MQRLNDVVVKGLWEVYVRERIPPERKVEEWVGLDDVVLWVCLFEQRNKAFLVSAQVFV